MEKAAECIAFTNYKGARVRLLRVWASPTEMERISALFEADAGGNSLTWEKDKEGDESGGQSWRGEEKMNSKHGKDYLCRNKV